MTGDDGDMDETEFGMFMVMGVRSKRFDWGWRNIGGLGTEGQMGKIRHNDGIVGS